jgi:hypothetical protein
MMYRDAQQILENIQAGEGPGDRADAPAQMTSADSSSNLQPGLLGLLDELSFGVAVVDLRREVLYASRIALTRLQGDGRLQIVNGSIEAATQQDNEVLEKAIEGTRVGRRSYVALGWGKLATDIAVLPQPSWGVPAAALVFEKSQEESGLGLYFFARAHNLTPAEERLLAILCEGVGVPTAAQRVGCAINTARTHIRGLLQKTGQPSLRALVGRIGNLPPVTTRVSSTAAKRLATCE